MILRKAALLSAAMALASTPAAALPAKAPSNGGTSHAPESTPAGPPAETPGSSGSNGAKDRSEQGDANAGGGARSEASHRRGPQGASRRSQSGSGHSSGQPGNRGSNRGHHNGDGGGRGNGRGQKQRRDRGASHACRRPHRVAYVAAGRLLSESLKENEDHTYSGEVTVEVKRTNHHARAAKGATVTYTVQDVHVQGPLSVQALTAGDRVRLIGGITFLPPRCRSSEFSPTRTIRRLVFHAPPHRTEEGKAEEPTT